MKMIVLFLALSCGGVLWSGEIPGISLLGAGSLVKRGKAMEDLEGWVLGDQAKAKEVLLEKYLRCSDPEVRVRLLELLERSYFPVKGFVGITMGSSPRRIPKGKVVTGVRVANVGKGTPADQSGLKSGDLILKIDDWEVKGGAGLDAQFAAQVQQHSPRTSVSLEIKRGQDVLRIPLKLGVLPVPSAMAKTLMAESTLSWEQLPADLRFEISGFQDWLEKEIGKDLKNLIADRRL